MKRLFVAMCLVMSLFLLAGCGSDQNVAEKESGEREIVVGLTQPAENLDQQTSQSEIDSQYFAQIYDTLFKKDAEGNFVGALAESYEVSDTKTEISVKLREGVMFSNGEEFTAEDFLYTVERGKAKTGTARYLASAIDKVEVIDDYNLVIHISEPNAALMEILSALFVINKTATEAAGEHYGLSKENVCGCGPYIIEKWEIGGDLILVANEDYYAGAPDIKRLRMTGITDSTAAVFALQTGEIDIYMSDVPGTSIADIKNTNGLNLGTYSSNTFNYLVMNCEDGMFKDLKMRKAVAYALNRDDVITVGTDGYGVMTNTVASPAFAGAPEGVKWYDQDVEKARSLVKEAGMEGKEVTLYTLAFDPYIQIATLIQDQLSNIGLNVKVQQLENNAFIDQLFDKNDYEIAVTFWTSEIKDFDNQVSSFLHTDFMGFSGNVSMYSDPEMDKLIEEGRMTYDMNERKAIYKQAMDKMYEDVPLVPLFFSAGNRAYTDDITIDPAMLQYRYLNNYQWVK
mgnify:CR=1 FL=1